MEDPKKQHDADAIAKAKAARAMRVAREKLAGECKADRTPLNSLRKKRYASREIVSRDT